MHTHSAHIIGPDFSMFIDGIPDKCDHDDNGDPVYYSKSGKVIMWHTYRQWAHLDTAQRTQLIFDYHSAHIDDPIISGCVACSKCKKPFSPPVY
jgi:hypothetical protein